MARIRSVKPEFWNDLALANLSRDARLLYIALWNQADEWARLHGDTRWIKGHCLPYDDDLGLPQIDALLTELATAKKVIRYVVEGAPYMFLPNLSEHQRLEPAKVPSRLPAPADADRPTPEPDPSQSVADSSERRADSSEPIVAKHVAGSMEHVAGSMVSEAPPRRDDVEAVCTRLAGRMVENGCRPPNITKGWRDAARLLLDLDNRDPNEVAALIDWCQADDFWRGNIQSLPKFREKYDQLRLQRSRGRPGGTAPARKESTTDARVRDGWALAQHFAEMDAQEALALPPGETA